MSVATAVTIGHFDGVHRGHVKLLETARRAVGESGRVLALTFESHPLSVLRPEAAPKPLSNLQQRRRWLLEAGACEVMVLPTAADFLSQTPESFLGWLVAEYRPDFIVEGRDFRFGRDRIGSAATLREFGSKHGYETIIIEDVIVPLTDCAEVRVRSSLIRWLVAQGRVRDARLLLGRRYEICGEVVSGAGRGGRDLGVRTANLAPADHLLPADGVYAGRATTDDGTGYPAAISVGTKPTFGEHPRVCESHLIGFADGDRRYGWTIRVEFDDWLRDQLPFGSVEQLIDQLQRDIDRVRSGWACG